MGFDTILQTIQKGGSVPFPAEANELEYARSLDAESPVQQLRDEFIFPTKRSLRSVTKKNTPNGTNGTNGLTNGLSAGDDEQVVYFCGNSLGLQPKCMRASIDAQLQAWASIGVYGHFNAAPESPLPPWQDMAAAVSTKMAPIVGAKPSEVVVMNTLTVNLQLLMASFYRPTEKRHKVILEWRPFPSDYYAIESHIRWQGLDPAKSMVEIAPDADGPGGHYISTASVLAAIDAHADEAALLLLPGLQYYSGQLFDIPTITAHARARGLVVGWDLAHAAGNVPVALHDLEVDFAVWCTYKYLNAGPGSMGGAFVHEKHGGVSFDATTKLPQFHRRLQGWYGTDKSVRFNMAKTFQPTVGAQGFQLSNPSAIDLAALNGALEVYTKTSVEELRRKSVVLTGYAQWLLDGILRDEEEKKGGEGKGEPAFTVITPRNPAERGAQLSVLLRAGLLEKVSGQFEEAGIVCDQRKPDVIRIAPVPIYNSFEDVWRCVDVLRRTVLG
ncbi:Uu.00g066150.m01.CDS01 [Anthostomella pinea]|uniref:Kynureninase n=1 Tax=Anthostomella pinea TaxID=933095 RepID=A0AAI8VUJ4_9PEZI|nr:Uu.00g066150.m01.CDS01 [Anthostomella pinea]